MQTEHGGLFTATGDGVTTQFFIQHGCPITPYVVFVQSVTSDAMGVPQFSSLTLHMLTPAPVFTYTVDSHSIIITYPNPPLLGAPDNLKWYWLAKSN